MKYIKLMILSFLLILSIGMGTSSASGLGHDLPYLATRASFVDNACSGLSVVAGKGVNCSSMTAADPLKTIIKKVVQILSLIVGALSVIMIIVAGFKFVTAGGDTNSVSSARNTLLYAAIGLIVAVLAQLIIHFALSTATNIQTGYEQTSYTRSYS